MTAPPASPTAEMRIAVMIATTRSRTTTSMITPNTCQPWPFTSARLRLKAANTPGCSTTTTGAITDQIVSRNRPGTMSRTIPIPMPMAARIETTMSVSTTGETLRSRSPIELSRRPSMTSRTSWTTMPW